MKHFLLLISLTIFIYTHTTNVHVFELGRPLAPNERFIRFQNPNENESDLFEAKLKILTQQKRIRHNSSFYNQLAATLKNNILVTTINEQQDIIEIDNANNFFARHVVLYIMTQLMHQYRYATIIKNGNQFDPSESFYSILNTEYFKLKNVI